MKHTSNKLGRILRLYITNFIQLFAPNHKGLLPWWLVVLFVVTVLAGFLLIVFWPILALSKIELSENTYLYTFSTIPQVLGATAAILAGFIQFKINRLNDTLIGFGRAAQERLGSTGYKLDDKISGRLRDGLFRKRIVEIENVLKLLSIQEMKAGFTKITRPNGLQAVYEDRFCKALNYKTKIQTTTRQTLKLSIFTIVLSVSLMPFADLFENNIIIGLTSLILAVLLFIFSLIKSYQLMKEGLVDSDY